MSDWFIMFTKGEWGGIYFNITPAGSFRITLGWFALTIMLVDGDKVLATSALWSDLMGRIENNDLLCDNCVRDLVKVTEEFYAEE